MLVIDATVLLGASGARDGFGWFGDPDLVAPPLAWSEARSTLHECARRGELPAAVARRLRRAVDRAPVEEITHPALGERAWDVADRMRLGRTHQAEYVALALILGCPLVTLDAELQRRARRICRVLGPTES